MKYERWKSLSVEMACRALAQDGAEMMIPYDQALKKWKELAELDKVEGKNLNNHQQIKMLRGKVHDMGQALIVLEKMGYSNL